MAVNNSRKGQQKTKVLRKGVEERRGRPERGVTH